MRRAVTPRIGMVEWFQIGDHARVEEALSDLRQIGVEELRTGVSWAEWCTAEGAAWIGWLLPRLAAELRVVPCLQYTPPSLGLESKVSSPPRRAADYADFVETVLETFGSTLEHVELWNEPTNPGDWDHRLDPQWEIYGDMVAQAAARVRTRGWRTVLGGMRPHDAHWLKMLAERGVLENVDVVGLHGFPGTWDFDWEGWHALVARVRAVLDGQGLAPDLWITQTGFSTWRHDQKGQVRTLMEALAAPVTRVYWHGLRDLHPELPHRQGFHADERFYHLGLRTAEGTPKLLYRLWSGGGLEAVRQAVRFGEGGPAPRTRPRPVVITGGAGFVGTNLAHRLLSAKRPVLLFDNLSRPGVEENLRWLTSTHGDLVQVEVGDVRDLWAVKDALRRAEQVFHFAAQVAVTTSLQGPLLDFEVNVRGTLNVLEALRAMKRPPPLVFTSTNKVYGSLADLALQEAGTRWEPVDAALRACGVGETRPLDFHSPYGCSKGAADQYVLDYARTFGIPAVVFRMSCIYGLHQQGNEDQGWVAHFARHVLDRTPLTLYGDGLQVRDVLFAEDLVDALLLAQEGMERLRGNAFNLGGGPSRSVSLLELLALLARLAGKEPTVHFAPWRAGDQRYYVADTARFHQATGWTPRVEVEDGVGRLCRWLRHTRRAAAPVPGPSERTHALRARRS